MPDPTTDVFQAMLQALQRIEESLGALRSDSQEGRSANSEALVAAVGSSADRLDARLEQLVGGLSHVAARLGETTARILELGEVTRALYKSVAEQLEIFENARINLRDAVQRVDADVQALKATR